MLGRGNLRVPKAEVCSPYGRAKCTVPLKLPRLCLALGRQRILLCVYVIAPLVLSMLVHRKSRWGKKISVGPQAVPFWLWMQNDIIDFEKPATGRPR